MECDDCSSLQFLQIMLQSITFLACDAKGFPNLGELLPAFSDGVHQSGNLDIGVGQLFLKLAILTLLLR
jgi:hypothetical protein